MNETLKFPNKKILSVGRWNDINYSAEHIKAMVEEVNSLDEAARDKALSIFGDHKETIDTWLGRATNLRWDEKQQAALADLEFVDEATIKKLKFQTEEQKKIDWGISPSLNIERDAQGIVKKINLRNLSLVVEPAQGDKAGLSAEKGGMTMFSVKIEDLEGKTSEEIKNLGLKFISEADAALKKIKKKVAEEEDEEEMAKEVDALITTVDEMKKKLPKEEEEEEEEKMSAILEELQFISNILKKKKKYPYDKYPYGKYPAGKYARQPVLRLNFQSDDQFKQLEGNRFKKELIKIGSYLDPRDLKSSLEVSKTRINGWIENFKRNLARVPVPIKHTDDPMRNTGWLVDLGLDGDACFGVVEFTNPEALNLIKQGSIKDASISLAPDFVDTKTGKHYGETIDHVALTISPFLSNLAAFEPIAAEYSREVIEMTMVKDKQTSQSQDVVMRQILDSNEHLQKRVLTLEKERDDGLKTRIEDRINKLVETGRLTPNLKDRLLKLALETRAQEIAFEKGANINLSEEILGIFDALEITFEMSQRTTQFSEDASKRKYLTEKEIIELGQDGRYRQLVKENKIKFDLARNGSAYWTEQGGEK